jgi:uncharacterized protein
VNDYAGLLAAGERGRLEAKLAQYERATGAQMAIAIFRSLEGEDLEDVANRLFQQWRLGQKGLDNGVLLVVFVQDRKLRFETGYGLEAVVPDAAAGQIIREIIAPNFKERRYAAGLAAAADAVYARIASGATSPPDAVRRRADGSRRRQRESEQVATLYALLFLGLAAVAIGGMALQAARQRGGYSAGRGGRWSASGPVFWGGGGGSGWGGGDGGFSGGGGESGGGGASGDW